MSRYKEFEGKNLDDAIKAACAFHDTTREKLEIEICNDAKGGIFGLVGAKKARIRARLVQLDSVLDDLETPVAGSGTENGKRPKRRAASSAPKTENTGNKAVAKLPEDDDDNPGNRVTDREERRPAKNESRHGGRPGAPKRDRAEIQKRQAVNEYNGGIGVASVAEMFATASSKENGRPARENKGTAEVSARGGKGPERKKGRDMSRTRPAASQQNGSDQEQDNDELRSVSFDQLDHAELEKATHEIVTRLTQTFLDDAVIAVTIGNDRVRVSITGVDDPGLLIGRDGQNLASLQYLVTRMLSSRMKALLRVQIDAGDYRERQDERLRELALSLAEKVKAGGRPQVTRPLSSYHRRVIHLTLQDDPLIQTHSKGEGEMKRVMVARRKPEKNT